MHFPLYCDSRGSSINSGTVNTFIYYELKDLVGFLTYMNVQVYMTVSIMYLQSICNPHIMSCIFITKTSVQVEWCLLFNDEAVLF